jgi:hypothetical protein
VPGGSIKMEPVSLLANGILVALKDARARKRGASGVSNSYSWRGYARIPRGADIVQVSTSSNDARQVGLRKG